MSGGERLPEQWEGLLLSLQHFGIRASIQGPKRAKLEPGNQTRVRRPFAGEVIRVRQESNGGWDGGEDGVDCLDLLVPAVDKGIEDYSPGRERGYCSRGSDILRISLSPRKACSWDRKGRKWRTRWENT